MTIPAWTLKLAAAGVIPVLVGVGVAISAPSPVVSERVTVSDDAFSSGADGIDYASVTGPRRPAEAKAVPACADPARRGDLRPC